MHSAILCVDGLYPIPLQKPNQFGRFLDQRLYVVAQIAGQSSVALQRKIKIGYVQAVQVFREWALFMHNNKFLELGFSQVADQRERRYVASAQSVPDIGKTYRGNV